MTVISTVSVRVAVTSLPAPLAIKGSARNRQDVRLTDSHVRNQPIPITGRSIGASLGVLGTYGSPVFKIARLTEWRYILVARQENTIAPGRRASSFLSPVMGQLWPTGPGLGNSRLYSKHREDQ